MMERLEIRGLTICRISTIIFGRLLQRLAVKDRELRRNGGL